jgi:hypothetical protein
MKIIGDHLLTVRKPLALMWLVATFCFALQLNAANVVTDWNAIASTTIVANSGRSAGASAVWFAYTASPYMMPVNAITDDLMDEVFWARIYAGFHYHHSLEVGRQLGERVAQELMRSHFRPSKRRD